MDIVRELYNQKAPRWVKVIRWREFGQRVIKRQKITALTVYLPLLFYFSPYGESPLFVRALFNTPRNAEEWTEARKSSNFNRDHGRNWGRDDYQYMEPPLYDLSERRKKYPQHGD